MYGFPLKPLHINKEEEKSIFLIEKISYKKRPI